MRHTLPLWTTAVLATTLTPLSAQDTAPAEAEEPRYVFEVESSSHIVRRDEERLLFRFNRDEGWDFTALLATLTPRFAQDSDETGVTARRTFGTQERGTKEIAATLRFTSKPEGEDLVGGVYFAAERPAGGAWGVDVVWAQADLTSDAFVFGSEETQLSGRVFWQSPGGLEVALFAADKGSFDLMRGARELLERLPRSEIVGAETLADLYLEEGRLEDSAGVAVGWGRDGLRASVHLKSGDEILPGFLEGDSFTGYGGELELKTSRFDLRTELDIRTVDPAFGFDSFDRGRLLVDFHHHLGHFTWGAGAYVQGTAETFDKIPDLYDTAGFGVTASWKRPSGKEIGVWAMTEEDAPDAEKVQRLAFFRRGGEREWGVGIRRDEIGEPRFLEEQFGPFVFGRWKVKSLLLDGDLGVQDGDVYGRVSIGIHP